MEELQKELTGEIKEVNSSLWQSLITVNALLATSFIAIANFRDLNYFNSIVVFFGFIASGGSCISLIMNFFLVKRVYLHIFTNQSVTTEEEKKLMERRVQSALGLLSDCKRFEIGSIIASAAGFIAMMYLLLVVLFYK